jgi:hypothetical protein
MELHRADYQRIGAMGTKKVTCSRFRPLRSDDLDLWAVQSDRACDFLHLSARHPSVKQSQTSSQHGGCHGARRYNVAKRSSRIAFCPPT